MDAALLNEKTKIKVSTVLNKDSKSYGKQYLIDQNEETCWNSDQGEKQWIVVNFDEKLVKIKQIHVKFQGGFSSSHCILINETTQKQIFEFYPEDINSNQVFNIAIEQQEESNSFRLVFNKNTDFFGRLIIYNLQFYGSIK